MSTTFSFFLPPSLRASITEQFRVKYDIPHPLAEDMLETLLSMLRNAPDARGRSVRDAATAHARLERIFNFLRGGATIKQVANIMDMSVPRVSQLLAEARQRGEDVPVLARGRPAGQAKSAAELLQLLRQGHHTREIVKVLGTSLSTIHQLVKLLRSRGESVPNPYEVDAWRLRLDHATHDALEAIRKFNGYDELADMLGVDLAKQEVERAELRADAKAKAKLAKSIEQERPAHVVTVPPEAVRDAAQKELRRQAVAPTPTPVPNARQRPPMPSTAPSNRLPTATALADRLGAAAGDDLTTPAPSPKPTSAQPPANSLQSILAALAAKTKPPSSPN